LFDDAVERFGRAFGMGNGTGEIDHKEDELFAKLVDGTMFSPGQRVFATGAHLAEIAGNNQILLRAASRNLERIGATHTARAQAAVGKVATTLSEAQHRRSDLHAQWGAYLQDASQRFTMMLDTLRERGDIFIEHEEAECPPVLIYDYRVVMDGAEMSPASNYMLLEIRPPEGIEIKSWKRPYMIIDPRAGHGAGIGGFKIDSQVGVALRDGHPVYFVSFRRLPAPGQTLASVTRTEAEFVREIMRRHPDAPRPIVVGNCQGGWATLLLAATNQDLTGPIVLNGAPVSPWAGEVGKDPMRYNGGVLGGTWQPMFWSDLGNGQFDGAHLVMNFEMLNPSRNFFGKYYDLYADVDNARERFLDFERWWGGFFVLNEAEIRWIVEQLFVGNRLVRNTAQLEKGRPIDVKSIRSPIIVFASHGDNITPPQQALNWIVESYPDAAEIALRGQRIIYMVHEEVGHLGIFVSSKIAKKEHTEMASTLKTIENLPPCLYEMMIESAEGESQERQFTVRFEGRKISDIEKLDDGTEDEMAFAAVARASEFQAELYDTMVRPFVQASVAPAVAELSRTLHPLRLQRSAFSSRNPLVAPLAAQAKQAQDQRTPVGPENLFLQIERATADAIAQSLDLMRDLRDMAYELTFFSVWGSPWARWYGRTHQPRRALKSLDELRALPRVQSALMRIDQGGFVEAVIRMLILLADSRGSVRRAPLERSARTLTHDHPFRALTPEERALIINEQTTIARFEHDRSIEILPALLKTEAERDLALKVVRYIPGALADMEPATLAMLQRFHRVLGRPEFTGDITEDPLAGFEGFADAEPSEDTGSEPAKPKRRAARTVREGDAA
jgi:pimeloyl-ACP methyl ester carboxylesterase